MNNSVSIPKSDTLRLATITQSDGVLHLRKLNDAYIADLKHGLGFWLTALLLLSVFGAGVQIIRVVARRPDGTYTLSPFLTLDQALLFALLGALVVLVNLIQDFRGLLSPHQFTFDESRNVFLVEGKAEGSLTGLRLALEDSFGTTYRIFRVTVTLEDGQKFVLAQTPMFAPAYPMRYDYEPAGLMAIKKHGNWKWAEYQGATTGFNKSWPEYRQLFSLYQELNTHHECCKQNAAKGEH